MIDLFLILPFFFLIWMYLVYPLILVFLSNIRKSYIINQSIEPYVSIIVCTYNESAVIDRRLKNLFEQEYPKDKMEIIVVDSSTDETRNIIKEKWVNKVILIEEEERGGKSKAINLGLEKSSNDIIILSDAPTLFDLYTIKNIVKNFADPRVGSATGKNVPIGGEELFWKFKNTLRNFEGQVDSTTWLSGELCAFRKGIINKVDEDSLADDMNISIKIREKGYRSIYDDSAIFIENVARTSKEFSIQKIRRSIGGIQEIFRFKHLIFNHRYGLYGMLILPMTFLYIIFNPFIFLSCIISFTYIILNINPYIVLFAPFLFSLAFLFKKTYPIRTIINISMTIYSQFLALIKYFQKDYNVKWKKIESSRKN